MLPGQGTPSCCSGREGGKPTLLTPPPPGLPLPSSGDVRSPDSSACCSLWRESRVIPKKTHEASAASHPIRSPSSLDGAAPDLGPSRASSTACSVPVPLCLRRASRPLRSCRSCRRRRVPQRTRRGRFQPAVSHQLCFSTAFFFFFIICSGCQADLAASRPLPAPQQTQPPTEPRHHLTAPPWGWQAPLKVHWDGFITPKPCPGCQKVWQLCSIPARWMLAATRDGRSPVRGGTGAAVQRALCSPRWSPTPNRERV